MSSERGQALVLAVMIIALASLAVLGLRSIQNGVALGAMQRQAGEAAAYAAGAAVADAHFAFVRGRREPPTGDQEAAFVGSLGEGQVGLAQARAIARDNGAVEPAGVRIEDRGSDFVVSLDLEGRIYRVAVEKVTCCPR